MPQGSGQPESALQAALLGTSCVELGGVGWQGSTSLTDYPKAGYVTTCLDGTTRCIVNIDDGANGKTPWQRLQDAVALMNTYPRVLVRNDSGVTVYPTGQLASAGSWGSEHQLYAYGSQRITIDLSHATVTDGEGWLEITGDYQHWKGFRIRNGAPGWKSAIHVYVAHRVTIEDFWIDHNAGSASPLRGIAVQVEGYSASGAGSGVDLYATIQDVVVWGYSEVSGTGTKLPDPIDVLAANHSALVRNIVIGYGNSDDCVDLWDSAHTRIIDSVCARAAYPVGSGPTTTSGWLTGDGNGFKMGGADSPYSTSDNWATGSVAVLNKCYGFSYNAGGAITLRNNTAWGNGYGKSCPGPIGNFWTSSGSTIDGLISFGAAGSDALGQSLSSSTHSLGPSTNPVFCDTANGDFSLCSGSPAIGYGSGGANIGASEIALQLLKANWHLLGGTAGTDQGITPGPTYACDQGGPGVQPLAASPSTFSVAAGARQTMSASGGVAPYAWTIVANGSGATLPLGNAGASVVYQAGPEAGTDLIRVTDSTGATTRLTATVTVSGGGGDVQRLAVSPASVAVVAGARRTMTVSGGAAPYTWTIPANNSGASLPLGNSGASITYQAGSRAGTDTIRVTDSTGATASSTVTVTVSAAGPPTRVAATSCMANPTTPTTTTCTVSGNSGDLVVVLAHNASKAVRIRNTAHLTFTANTSAPANYMAVATAVASGPFTNEGIVISDSDSRHLKVAAAYVLRGANASRLSNVVFAWNPGDTRPIISLTRNNTNSIALAMFHAQRADVAPAARTNTTSVASRRDTTHGNYAWWVATTAPASPLVMSGTWAVAAEWAGVGIEIQP